PLPAARFVQGLGRLVRHTGAEDETLRGGFDRVLPRSFEERPADAATPNIGANVEIVQDPERLERDRGERGVELCEARRFAWLRVRQIDHRLVALDALADERPRSGQIRALPVELAVPIEAWHQVVEIVALGTHDANVDHDHTVGFPS